MSIRQYLKHGLAQIISAFFALSCAATATASTFPATYTFGVPINSQTDPVSATFAQLDIKDLGSNTYNFKLSAGDLNSVFYKDAFITDLYINTPSSIRYVSWGSISSGIVGSDTPTKTVYAKDVEFDPIKKGVGSYSWNFKVEYPESGSGGGVKRLTANEWIMWNVVFNAPLTFESPEFGLHVQALNGNGDSGWYGPGTPPPAVPLPAAAWLFGSALIGFVALSNRRKV